MDSQILEHSQQRTSLARMVKSNTLAHSSLLVGPSGIGKKLIAKEIAKALLCDSSKEGSACNQCSSCSLIESGNHPDFYLVECESSDFNAEQARELLYSINLAPYRANKRVIIFNDADSLSAVVANLLLKTLEEPRNDTFFFLIASNASRLPIPVVSRCQTWRFSHLSDSAIKNYLQSKTESKQIDDLVQLANGSLEHVKDLDSFIPVWKNIKEKLQVICSGNSTSALSFASELSKDKAEIGNQLSLIRIYLRAMLQSENQPEKKLILADSLENAITAQRLITERNLAPLSVLNLFMLGLSGQLPPQGRLISEIVV